MDNINEIEKLRLIYKFVSQEDKLLGYNPYYIRRITTLINEIKQITELLKIEKENEIICSLHDEEKQKRNEINEILMNNELNKYDNMPCIITFSCGVGGGESEDLVKLFYYKYLDLFNVLGFQHETQNIVQGKTGFRSVVVKVSGRSCFKLLKFESGIHCIKRVPPITEAHGRVHTSTIRLSVIPDIVYKTIKLSKSEIILETFKASGPGGQHRNVTESAVRATHIGTNISVVCSKERDKNMNQIKAIEVLTQEVNAQRYEQILLSKREISQSQVHNADRSDSIRVFYFKDNTFTDRRCGRSGKIDYFITDLIEIFKDYFVMNIEKELIFQLIGINNI